jgi:hypothetical protein
MRNERHGSLHWDEAKQTWKVRVTVTHADGTKSRPWYTLDTPDQTIAARKGRELVARVAQAVGMPVGRSLKV